jgi:hypothetical protein
MRRDVLLRSVWIAMNEPTKEEELAMFIVAQHTIKDAPKAFSRGQNLLDGVGAPAGVRVREFYPSRDQSAVFCLWEGDSVDELREYVDATLGDSSENAYFEVAAEQARGLPETVAARA